MSDSDKQALIDGSATVQTEINVLNNDGTIETTLTETNSVIDWNHEDFRLVKEEGWIGQFVARQVTGNLHNLSDDFSITDKELELKLGVRINNNTNWYSLGNFLVTKVTDDEVNDKTSFEALDYTKKFNKPYVDRMTYPCTAGDLAQDVCDQCGVILGSTTFKNSDYEITGNTFTNNESCRDVMKAIGKLALSWVRIDWDNKVYIDFNPLPFKNQFDKENTSWYRTANGTFINTGNTDTTRIRTNSFAIDGGKTYVLSGVPSGITFYRVRTYSEYNGTQIDNITPSNNTFTLGSNIKYIHLLFSGSNFTDETNELMKNADIVLKEEPSQYETFGNNKYYNLKTQKEVFGPVDKVVIGYSAIEGERTYIGEENGTCVINVFDNPLVFNQEQRASIIESARDLLGMTFMPLNTLTVGHPWLKGNEIVRVSDMESVSHDTIPFDRTIQYFGHIKTLINSTTETKTNDNLAYKPEMVKNFERSEIYNDQINKQIGIIIEEQQGTNSRLNQTIATLDGTIQRVSVTEEIVNDIVTTTQTSIGKNHLYIEDAKEENALSYNVDGATEQQTYSGKNLAIVSTGNNILISNQLEAGTYTFSLTLTNNVGFNLKANSSSGTTILAKEFYSTGRQSVTFTLNEATSIFLNGFSLTSGKTYIESVSNYQIETGSTATNYEPYVGGVPSPNPDYPQEIKTIPSIENLCESIFSRTDLTQYSTILFIESDLKPNTTYTLSFKGTSGNRLYTNENLFSQVVFTINSGITSITVTTKSSISKSTANQYEEGKGWKILKNAGGGVPSANTFENVMLEEGLISHNYVPYGSKYARVKITGKNLLDFNKSVNGSISENSTSETLNNDNQAITSEWILCEPNTTYIISGNNRNRWQTKSTNGTISYAGNSNIITTNEDTKCFRCYYYYSDSVITPDTIKDVQIEQIRNDETESTSFESYKEREVLIDLSKENLLTLSEDNHTVTTNTSDISMSTFVFNNTNGFTRDLSMYTSYTTGVGDWFKFENLDIGKTYTLSWKTDGNFNNVRLFASNQSTTVINCTPISNGNATFTATESTMYFRTWTYVGTLAKLYYVNLFEGNNPTPYYELCKIGDYKDNLFIDASGNCRITKNIGKRIVNGSETFQISKSKTNSTYFQMDNIVFSPTSSSTIPNAKSSHFLANTGDVLYNNDIEGFTFNISGYLRINVLNSIASTINNLKTWLSTNPIEIYYPLTTPETITLPNTKIPLFEGINHITFIDNLETDTSIEYYRNTALSDTYATTTQLNDVSVEKTQEIQTVRQEVITEISNTNVRIDVVNETIDETGVPIVNTGTGYTFDIEGLKIEKSDQDVKTVIDNDGLATSYQNTEILTVRSNGIEAENMTVRKFYVQKPIRMEKTKSIEDGVSVGLGFFYVGE